MSTNKNNNYSWLNREKKIKSIMNNNQQSLKSPNLLMKLEINQQNY